MKLLRILRAGRIFKRFETSIEIDYAQLQLVQFGCMIVFYGHWMACVWGLTQARAILLVPFLVSFFALCSQKAR